MNVWETYHFVTMRRSLSVWQGKGALGCASIFNLLKKMFTSLTTCLGLLYNMSLFLCSPWFCVTFSKTRTDATRTHKTLRSALHIGLFSEPEKAIVYFVLWTLVIGLDSKLPRYSEDCKCGNGLIYFFVTFFKFLSARRVCGINVEEVIRPQSYFRHP